VNEILAKLFDLGPCQLANVIKLKDQTLSYFGLSSESLRRFCDNTLDLRIDRIEPIGYALDFYPFWNKHDLLIKFYKRLGLF
jgi:hypothetical protein